MSPDSKSEHDARSREYEDRYRILFDEAAEAIVLFDPESTGMIEFNKQAHASLGYTREEFGRLSLTDIEAAESPEEVRQHLEKILREGLDLFETRHRAKDGEIRDVQVSARVITIQGKKFVQAIFRDITRQKRDENEIRNLLQVIENAREALLVFDADTKIVFANTAAGNMFGYAKDDLVGLYPRILIVAPDSEAVVQEIRRLVKEQEHWEGELRGRKKDGAEFDAYVRVGARRDRQGQIVNFVSTQRDITEAKRTGEALEAEKERAQMYLDIARVMIVALDVDGRVTLVNRKGCELLEGTEAEILGKDWFESFVPSENRAQVKEAFCGLLRGETEGIEYYENEVATRTGKIRVIAWHNVCVEDGDGNRIGTLSSAEDITDRKEAEAREARLKERLTRAKRMESLGVLAGGIAHDLNNILGPMVALPDLLADDFRELQAGQTQHAAEALESLDKLQASSKRAAEMIKDLMILGRSEEFGRAATNLDEIIRHYLDSQEFEEMRRRSPEILFDIELAADPPRILASETHVTRVLSNLIRNAVYAIRKGGKVTIRTSTAHLDRPKNGYEIIDAGDYVVLEVVDTGEGMKRKLVDKIFEPFFTTRRNANPRGSGLGLSIVHGVVKEHAGFIDVKTEVGRGSLFRLYFPRPAKSMDAGASPATGIPRGENERVLVVDDEPGQRFLLRRTLQRLGYQVSETGNGRDAVEMFQCAREKGAESPFDLVVLDVILEEGFDGIDVYTEIARHYPDQRVLVTSGYSPTDRAKELIGRRAGWLSKPFDVQDLARAVRIAIDRV